MEHLIIILKELKQYCSSEQFDINEFTLMLKEYERDYGIKSNQILELLYNKDLLLRKISMKTKEIDNTINSLKKQISNLENQKQEYGSLICELHDHNIERTEEYDSKSGHGWFCTNCGKSLRLEGYEVNNYLRLQDESQSKIYKHKIN